MYISISLNNEKLKNGFIFVGCHNKHSRLQYQKVVEETRQHVVNLKDLEKQTQTVECGCRENDKNTKELKV